MAHWVQIPNAELTEGAISSHEHLRIIRDNTTIIEKLVYGQVAPKVVDRKHWRLINTESIRTKVGEGCRHRIFGRCLGHFDIHRFTSNYTWQAEFNSIGTEKIPILPPRPGAILIGIESVGDGIGFEDETNWRLGDFDVSISSENETQNINVFYNTYALGDNSYRGSTFRDVPNGPPTEEAHYPNGSSTVPADEKAPDSPPAYDISFRTIWASGGSL